MHEHTRAGVFENVSFYIILGMTFLIPLFFVPFNFISIQFGTSLLFAFGAIVSFILYIIGIFVSGSINLPRPAKYILGMTSVVPIVYVLAGVANGFSRVSFLGYSFDESAVGFILLAFLYMFLVSVICNSKQRIFYIYTAFLFSSILFSLFLLARVLFGSAILSFGVFNDVTTTVMGNWNSVGIFFGGTALLALLSVEMLRVSKLFKGLLLLAAVLSLFFLALVNFSIVWIVLAVSSFLFVLYRVFNSNHGSFFGISLKQKISRIPLYSFVMFLLATGFFFWGQGMSVKLAQFFHVNNVDVRPSLSVTLDIIRSTIQNHPLFGSGPNTFVSQWLSYKPNEVLATIFWNTDFAYGIGLLPTFAVTTGLFGILSWLLFLGLYVYLGFKSIFAKIDDHFERFLLVSSFFISLYLWIMAIVYVPSTTIFILTFLFTGLFFGSLYTTKVVHIVPIHLSENPRRGFLFSIGAIAISLGVLSLGYGLLKSSQSLWYFQKSAYAMNASGDIATAETLVKKAVDAVPYDVYYRTLAQIEVAKLNDILSKNKNNLSSEDTQKQVSAALSDAITAALAAKNADDANYLNWIALGQVYESVVPLKIQGAYESAQFAYGEALRRNPNNPGIALLFAKLEIDHGDMNKAKDFVAQAISAKQNYLDAYFLLAQIEIYNGNMQGAIDSVKAVSVLSPNDPGIFFQLGYLKYSAGDFRGAIDALEQSISLSPQYANAKYFLGLSYEAVGDHTRAIQQFSDLKTTNPDSAEVNAILTALEQGKPIFASQQKDTKSVKPGDKTLPLKEKQ